MSFFFQQQPTQLSKYPIQPGTNLHFQCITPQASGIIVGNASENSGNLHPDLLRSMGIHPPKIHNAHFFQQ